MNEKDLTDLGLTGNEARVIVLLVMKGSTSASNLINETKLHKRVVYDILYKLVGEGLVSFIEDGRRKIFSISSETAFVDYIDQKKETLEKRRIKAEFLSREISLTRKNNLEESTAFLLVGIKSTKNYLKQTLEKGDSLVIGAPEKSVKILGEDFWINLNLKSQEKKNKSKMIFNPSLKKFASTIKNRYSEIKFLNLDIEQNTEIIIQKDTVSTIIWSDEPVIFQIKNKDNVDSYKKYFEILWSKSKS